VGIAGVIVGIIFIRFNILAVLVWHFTVDALYTAFLLFRSGNTYFIVSAGITTGIMLIPLVVACAAYLKTKRFIPEEDLLNRAEGTSVIPGVEEGVEEIPSIAYQPLPTRRILIGGVVVILLLCLYFIKVETFGKFIRFAYTGQQAQKISEEFLGSKGVETKDYRSVTMAQDSFDKYVAKYVLQKENFDKLNQIYEENLAGFFWSTRFYKSLQEEEYRVYVDPKKNQIFNFRHTVAEDAEGTALTKEEALAQAVAFLQSRGIDTVHYVLKESSSERKKNRQDHTFVWEAKENDPRNVEQARYRMLLVVQGDEVSHFGRFMKLPEEWERERRKSTAISAVRTALKIAVLVVFLGFTLLSLINRVRRGEVRWRPVLTVAGALALIAVLGNLNELPSLYSQYPTSIPLQIFQTSLIIGILIGVIATFILAGISLGIITSFYPESLRILKRENRRNAARDALICALLSLGAFLGMTQLIQILNAGFPHLAVINGLPMPSYVQTPLPFVSYLSETVLHPIFAAAIIGALVYYIKNHLRQTWHYLLAVPVAVIAFVSGDAKTTAEFLFNLILLVVWVIPVFILITWFLRNNFLAYILTPFLILAVKSSYELLSQKASLYQTNGMILAIICAVPLVWLFIDYLTKTKKISV
jgi:hypothetical protein